MRRHSPPHAKALGYKEPEIREAYIYKLLCNVPNSIVRLGHEPQTRLACSYSRVHKCCNDSSLPCDSSQQPHCLGKIVEYLFLGGLG